MASVDHAGSISFESSVPVFGSQVTAGTLYALVSVASVDVTPPVISNVLPVPGTLIGQFTALQFDVTDNAAIRRTLIKVAMAGVPFWEVAHDGDGFAPNYSLRSSRIVITGGFRYSLIRDFGWVAAPTIEPFCIDTGGNENA